MSHHRVRLHTRARPDYGSHDLRARVRHSASTIARVSARRGRRGVRARAAPHAAGISGDAYVVTPEQIETFERDGYVHIPAVLTEDEMAEIEEPMMRFLRGEVNPEERTCAT